MRDSEEGGGHQSKCVINRRLSTILSCIRGQKGNYESIEYAVCNVWSERKTRSWREHIHFFTQRPIMNLSTVEIK